MIASQSFEIRGLAAFFGRIYFPIEKPRPPVDNYDRFVRT